MWKNHITFRLQYFKTFNCEQVKILALVLETI